MNAGNPLSRRIMGIDYRVWIAMALVWLFSLGLYGYKRVRLAYIKDVPCAVDTITVDNKTVDAKATCYINRPLLFKLQTAAAGVKWTFGDGTDAVTGPVVSHTFTREDTYQVTATINGQCRYEEALTVKNPLVVNPIEQPQVVIVPDIMEPKIGSTVRFYGKANIAVQAYEWKVSGSDAVQRDAVAAFTFNAPGTYTVQLILNNDLATRKEFKIKVVADTPPPPEALSNGTSNGGTPNTARLPGALIQPGEDPFAAESNQLPAHNPADAKQRGNQQAADSSKQPPKPLEVDPTTFMNLLQDVLYENRDIQDLYEYLDYKGSTMVKVNEATSLVPLREFCKKMQNLKKKKRKIESVSFKKDDKNSIGTILVTVPDNEGFLKKLWPFK